MLNHSHQVSKFNKKLKKEQKINKSFFVQEEIKEKQDAEQESSVEEIQQEIKEKPKDSDGVTHDLHIELNIFPCTASEKRNEIGCENTKKPVLRITKSDSETEIISQKIVDYTESSELEDDTSDCCQKNVDHDFNTDTLNVKDPIIGGKLPDAQPSSDYEEQEDIPISSKRENVGRKVSRKENK